MTSAAGMAAAGLRPVVAVYSSFLQRAYDQILHHVSYSEPAGAVLCGPGRSGGKRRETHQGIFDLSFLSSIPNMSVMAPKNLWELREMIQFGVNYDCLMAIAIPEDRPTWGLKEALAPIEYGKSDMLFEESEIALLAAEHGQHWQSTCA